ncbi:uncharacterized protein LOC143303858 [Bombus vancouverensis nearcticus]|uniref:uncharacterized protein LOC143303858 n=1 Tax=Bombus vancouverensis nearcticus TaxID=2705178 RepID=UPI00402B3F9D
MGTPLLLISGNSRVVSDSYQLKLRFQLINEGDEHRGVEAVLPNWEASRSPNGLPLTFRMTQVLTGHGVFGEFLRKIRRETTDICHHCGEGRDTAQHTLEFRPAWELPRYTLRFVIGERSTPWASVEAMLSGPQEYEALRLFGERAMFVKEQAERQRKGNSHPCWVTRWRRSGT